MGEDHALSTTAVLERMMIMAELISQQVKPTQIVRQVMAETSCSESAAWVTWRGRNDWLPKLVNVEDTTGTAISTLLNDIREIRRLALNKAATTSGPASVGALGRALDAVKTEAELRNSLGMLQVQAPTQLEKPKEVKRFDPTAYQEYLSVAVELVMAEQAGQLSIPDELNIEQSLDTDNANPESDEIPPA